MKAFVAGATGQTGRHIVTELVKRNIPVRALVRDLELAQKLLPPEVELVRGNVLFADTLAEAIADCDVVVCATGAKPSLNAMEPYLVDYIGTKNLVNAAKAKNIKHFAIVSSLCVSKFFHPLNLFWLVLFWKKQAEKYLQNSGLTYTIVRPGGLLNYEKLGGLVMSSADTLFEGSIPRTKVAQVTVEALFEDAAKNKLVEIVVGADRPDRPISQLFAKVT
ncbi:MAG: SDR family oxidoreductase [Pseudanabaena sp. M135S2SP2A07QC]|nr:SDR family oxidoreductase [Pseudanabaena sp. M090S1SP2A07QC]MCA6505315.1 SDR family oxidoreductase [Pseudanabaena sp. M172S2SP2A07QC]MCA6518833.1 SDR family oxidoreductase [Pseudanabaena sp. M110S1SP2A07QC]MCA6521720.1 SDR family oxidoreductase [Pseudanabaena sp. M051S1SP2A07QC]MCA6527890.1 SDR family oxidoreductase [Pseudanabaena sp. M179S2SP2A07QC]MCA6529704.1 SDR family oxidoreductase [Pseudanabaena sp. M125S2SP2A07QC]MCA6532758.1 SDR family oxidoreductase [Pseudanabaena sp. M176S2SP2A0